MALLDCNIALTSARSFQGQCVDFAETFTGRAVVYDANNVTIQFDSADPTQITAFTLGSGTYARFAINNVGYPSPFTGANKSLELDGLKRKVRKNFVFRANILSSTYGSLDSFIHRDKNWIVVAEKKLKFEATGEYPKYEVFGANNPMKVADDGLSWDPYSAIGATVTLTTLEDYVTMYMKPGTKTVFDNAWTQSPS